MSRTFDPSASWIPAALRKPVKEALSQGWTPGEKRIKAGGWFIYSPKRTEKFYVPITCRDPDEVAKKLRSLINKAYLAEDSAFEPGISQIPGQVERVMYLQDKVLEAGPAIVQGPSPYLTCPDCDGEWLEMEGFLAHQKACRDRVRASLAAEQEQVVPEEGGVAERPSEDVSQSMPDSTEPAQSGTIGTKEETPLVDESTATPEAKKKAKKGGYTWTHVEEPLHKLLYEAIRYTRRWKGETDSKWAKRLAQYIEEEGLLNTLVFEVDADAKAAHVLDQIRDLLGEEPDGASEEEIEQFKKDIEEKDAKIAELGEKVTNLKGVLSTLSDLARETDK